MGCDIHLHVEIKVEGAWQHYQAPGISRDYRLFAKMAGVRNYENEIVPISEPKGLPKDLTLVTAKDAEEWGVDGHSHSWLDKHEIARLAEWCHERVEMDHMRRDLEYGVLHSYLFGNSYAGPSKWPEEQPAWLEDVRFVFWFDN